MLFVAIQSVLFVLLVYVMHRIQPPPQLRSCMGKLFQPVFTALVSRTPQAGVWCGVKFVLLLGQLFLGQHGDVDWQSKEAAF